MSKRRTVGDWIWLTPNSGFVGESNKYKAEIQPENDPPPCFECDDPECREWSTLFSEPIAGKRYMLCHVPECRMLDDQYNDADTTEQQT